MIRAAIVAALAFAAPAQEYSTRQHNSHVAGSYDVWVAVESWHGSPLLNHQIVSADPGICRARGAESQAKGRPFVTCVRATLTVPRR